MGPARSKTRGDGRGPHHAGHRLPHAQDGTRFAKEPLILRKVQRFLNSTPTQLDAFSLVIYGQVYEPINYIVDNLGNNFGVLDRRTTVVCFLGQSSQSALELDKSNHSSIVWHTEFSGDADRVRVDEAVTCSAYRKVPLDHRKMNVCSSF